MATTIPIPLTTLPVGSTTFGPVTVSALTAITLTVDRTVAGGLNSLTSASVLTISFDDSHDNGVTWTNRGITHSIGGTILHNGVARTSDTSGVSFDDAGAVQVRAVVTVSGPSSIAVAGSLTTSP